MVDRRVATMKRKNFITVRVDWSSREPVYLETSLRKALMGLARRVMVELNGTNRSGEGE